MKNVDLKDLIIGLLAVIFLAMSFGQYDRLREFAKDQAAAALKPWPAHRFFPKEYVERSWKNSP